MTTFEVRDIKGNVIIKTNNAQVYDYCIKVFKVTEQVASSINYIITNGYKCENMKEIIEKNIKNMIGK